MATYDYTEGTQAQSATMMSYASAHSCHVLKRKFNVATVIDWNSTLTSNSKISSGDVFKVLAIPDDTYVLLMGMKVITAFGACTDIDLGSGGDPNGWLDAKDPNGASAGAHFWTDVDEAWGPDNYLGYVYTSADTLDIVFNADETTGEALIWAVTFDVADDEGTD